MSVFKSLLHHIAISFSMDGMHIVWSVRVDVKWKNIAIAWRTLTKIDFV